MKENYGIKTSHTFKYDFFKEFQNFHDILIKKLPDIAKVKILNRQSMFENEHFNIFNINQPNLCFFLYDVYRIDILSGLYMHVMEAV